MELDPVDAALHGLERGDRRDGGAAPAPPPPPRPPRGTGGGSGPRGGGTPPPFGGGPPGRPPAGRACAAGAGVHARRPSTVAESIGDTDGCGARAHAHAL